MAYEMTIKLTDQEYAALAAKSGKQPEMLLCEIMMQRLQPSLLAKRLVTRNELLEKQYCEGKILNIPTQ